LNSIQVFLIEEYKKHNLKHRISLTEKGLDEVYTLLTSADVGSFVMGLTLVSYLSEDDVDKVLTLHGIADYKGPTALQIRSEIYNTLDHIRQILVKYVRADLPINAKNAVDYWDWQYNYSNLNIGASGYIASSIPFTYNNIVLESKKP